jgi:hypothetical protein
VGFADGMVRAENGALHKTETALGGVDVGKATQILGAT